jgi:hypothetical protein
MWPFGARIFGVLARLQRRSMFENPVTELKRRQNPKRPLPLLFLPEWLQYFLNRSKKRTSFPVRFRYIPTFQRISPPISVRPHAVPAMPAPASTNPDGPGMRSVRPVATDPYPTAAPFPLARNPNPNFRRTRRYRHDFGLHRGRIVVITRGLRRRSRGMFINHAPRQQRQGECDKQRCFYQ